MKDTGETETKAEPKLHPRRGARDIVVEWPDPPMAFKEHTPTTLDDVEYPVLLIPTGLGRQIIYNRDDQQTFWKKVPPAWWLYPNATMHLYGEEFRPDMGAAEFWITFVYNMTEAGWNNPITPTEPVWLINDINQPDYTAAQRAYAMVNLGPQPTNVSIAKIYQANSAETLKKYMATFSDAGFKAAILRGLDHMLGEPEYILMTDQ